MSQGDVGTECWSEWQAAKTPPIPFPLHRMVRFCRPGLSEVEIHVGVGLTFVPLVWSVCFHHDYQNITEKSPRGRCRGHFRQASVSRGKFSIKARGGHLPYLCPMPPWHSPQGKDGKEDRRAGERKPVLYRGGVHGGSKATQPQQPQLHWN